jgi:hypothetical protein
MTRSTDAVHPKEPATESGRREKEEAEELVRRHGDGYAVTRGQLSQIASELNLPPNKTTFLKMAKAFSAHSGYPIGRAGLRRLDCLICFFCDHPDWTDFNFKASCSDQTTVRSPPPTSPVAQQRPSPLGDFTALVGFDLWRPPDRPEPSWGLSDTNIFGPEDMMV